MTICGKEVRLLARSGVPALIALALALVCAGAKAGATWGATSYDPASDPYSMYNVSDDLGASSWWDAGYTGKGIDVALIDTGVSPVAGLNTSGKVAYGPDLSIESQNTAFRNLDTFGHGTFMAGLIAGKDSTLTAPYSSAPASAYRGVAPDARIVSLKVGTADGGVDVSQVIAAIDWVVQHAHDKGFNIRVINLSYGTNSLQDYSADPLAYAVEQAWKKGIVVVAAAGNSGFQKYQTAPGLADPAYDPFVLAVGGSDTNGTATTSDDTVGDYSANAAACNTDCRAPDFVAPGSHMQGLRVPNSYIDANHPEGRLDTRYFRGSGTSEATAITSGAVALILQRYPNMTPDQVKDFLSRSTDNLCGANKRMAGYGELDLGLAFGTSTASSYSPWFVPSNGSGSLEISRGTDHLSRNGVVLQGEKDIFGKPFNASAMASLEAAGASWSGGAWNGSTWSGASWSGSTWSGATWSGNSWSGSSWSGSTWSGNSWSGSTWSGASWSGSSWSGASWSGNSWSGGSWQGATWG
jgi:subtilisin family serine protease